jgi:microcystin-dependent protein
LLGVPIPWLVATIPEKTTELDGSTLVRADYPDLFALWGTTFGAGDGSTTFGKPDLRKQTLAGYMPGDPTFGTLAALIGAETVSHSHPLSSAGAAQIYVTTDRVAMNRLGTLSTYNRTHKVTASGLSSDTGTANSGAGLTGNTDAAAPSVIQPTAVVKWIVYAQL